jgi:hypothetical protein
MESTGSAATDEHVLWNVVEKWWIPVPPSHISSSTAEVLIFITDMGEPWNHDAMSKNFLMIDFQLLGEQNDDGCETIGKRNPLETTLFHGEFHVSMCNWFHFLIWRWLNSNCWWPESWMCWTPVGAPSRLTREDGLSGPLMDGATPTHLQRDHDQWRPWKSVKIGENMTFLMPNNVTVRFLDFECTCTDRWTTFSEEFLAFQDVFAKICPAAGLDDWHGLCQGYAQCSAGPDDPRLVMVSFMVSFMVSYGQIWSVHSHVLNQCLISFFARRYLLIVIVSESKWHPFCQELKQHLGWSQEEIHHPLAAFPENVKNQGLDPNFRSLWRSGIDKIRSWSRSLLDHSA